MVRMTELTPDEGLANAMERHALSRPGSSVVDVASDLVGLHNSSQSTPYLSMLARVSGFARADLEAAMWDRWELARIRAMRLTVFVFPHDLMEIAAAATRHLAEPFAARWLRDSGMSQEEFDVIAADVEAALADGPSTTRDLRQALAASKDVDVPGVVSRLCDQGRIVGGAPPRSWRSLVRRYHRWQDVLPEVDLHRWDEPSAICELIRRYVDSYGPVTLDDIAWWTGIAKGTCREAIATLDTRSVAVDGWPGPLVGAPDGVGGELDEGVHALPLLDPYVQGYRDRTRFLEPGRERYVYDGGGNSAATLVRRGRIIGVWQPSEEPTESVRYHLFDAGDSSVAQRAEDALAAGGALYFDRPVDVIAFDEMQPLDGGGGRSAAHPLDETIHRAARRR